MSYAYVDSSVFIAILADEPGAAAMSRKLQAFQAVSSALLEAEVRAFAARSYLTLDESSFDGVAWLVPSGSSSALLKQVLEAGPVSGADLFHLASALQFFGEAALGRFLTLKRVQREAAAALGFVTDWH